MNDIVCVEVVPFYDGWFAVLRDRTGQIVFTGQKQTVYSNVAFSALRGYADRKAQIEQTVKRLEKRIVERQRIYGF